MKNRMVISFLLLFAISRPSANAETRIIVRDSLGAAALQASCVLLHCSVAKTLDGPLGTLFLVTAAETISVQNLVIALLNTVGVVNAEPDRILHVGQLSAPAGLYDTTPLTYFGDTVWEGYVTQPAAGIVNLGSTQVDLNISGSGIVGVIDTGVDPTHPVLADVVVSGRDFTRDQNGGSELTDIDQSSMAVVNGATPVQVNQSSMAVVNSTGSSVFTQPEYAAFGHGTMVAGIIHLVAPTAQIMPLKAFHADGTGYLSDIIAAVYYGRQHNARVLNMSFDLAAYSTELTQAINYAVSHQVICIASVGNDGQAITVYPAGLSNVIGVASTTNADALSGFSNYGQPLVWIGAPGEGVVTTYPYGTYAAGWGTSFSTPFVSGAAALLLSIDSGLTQASAAQSLSNAVYISTDLGYGRLDIHQAALAWCAASGAC